MLTITIPEKELYDEQKQQFITVKETKIQLEHSLVSISKWESKWHKPFLNSDEKTSEELMDYIYCMSINSIDKDILKYLSKDNIDSINKYISDSMTATTFSDSGKNGKREIVTSEVIYYWMVTLQIPFECQKWHINRLLTLIRVCNEKNNGGKKRSNKDTINHYAALNKARRAKYHSRG